MHTLSCPIRSWTNKDLEKLRGIPGATCCHQAPALFRAADGEVGLKHALDDLSNPALMPSNTATPF